MELSSLCIREDSEASLDGKHFEKKPHESKPTIPRVTNVNTDEMRNDGLQLPNRFGEVLTADHKVLSLEMR